MPCTVTFSFDILDNNQKFSLKRHLHNKQVRERKKKFQNNIKTYGSTAPKLKVRHQAFATLMNSITF